MPKWTHVERVKAIRMIQANMTPSVIDQQGSLTVWALYAYFSDSQNAAF